MRRCPPGALLLPALLALTACPGGADPGARVPDAATTQPGQCGLSTVAEVEEKILLPKCGRPGDPLCHGTGKYAPRITAAGGIAAEVLDVTPVLNCRRDKLVSRQEPAKSYLLAKIQARGSLATCSDGSNGGPRMPYQDAPQLTAGEQACVLWWVNEIVK
jgi:hypothetical protein